MSKITEYTSASTFDANDVLLKDGENGTMIISVEDAASELKRLSGVDDDISGVTQTVTQRIDTIASNIAGVEDDYIASKDYAIGDLFVVNNVLYKATAAIAEEDIIDTETNCAVVNLGDEIGDIRSELSNKANVDGSYDEFTAGSSKQLLGTVFIEDDEPYHFRTSGGSIDIGDREYDEIVGGSIVWNQMMQNGNFESANGWRSNSRITVADNTAIIIGAVEGSSNVSLYREDADIVSDHKYLSIVSVWCDNANTFRTRYPLIGGDVSVNANEWKTIANVRIASDEIDRPSPFGVIANSIADATYKYKNFMLFDLTQMFGSEIADYIYNLDVATPGAGVAWFRKYFPKDYYEYNAGELMHVSDLQSHDTVGFNLWDEEWEVGYYDENGNPVASTAQIRSKNFIHVIPGVEYYTKMSSHRFCYYTADKTFIGRSDLYDSKNHLFVVPDNCAYIKFHTDIAGGTYQNDICINLSWDGERDGEYEPYVKHSYPLDSSLTLRGIPKLSTGGKLYYDGDHYKSDGTVERRYGIVDLGTLEWEYQESFVRFKSTTSLPQKALSTSANLICAIYEGNTKAYKDTDRTDKIICTDQYSRGLLLRDSSYTDAASLKASLSGVYMVYELAEPTTEEAQPFQSPQIVDDFGTEEYVTSSIVPVGHTTQYDSNLRAKLEMAPNSPDGDGDYLVRQTSGQNEYVPYTDGGRITALEGKIPAAPSANGSYILKCTVTDGTATYAWVAE